MSRHDPEAEPRPCGSLSPSQVRCLQVGFDRHQQRLVRDRGLRSPTLCRRLLGVLAGGHGVERGAGQCPRRRRPAAGRRPDPCVRAIGGALIAARTSAAPKESAEGLLSWQASSFRPCMVNSPIRLQALSSSACTGSPLRCLSEASIPTRSLCRLSRHCSSRAEISTRRTGAFRSSSGSQNTARPQSRWNDLTLALLHFPITGSTSAPRQAPGESTFAKSPGVDQGVPPQTARHGENLCAKEMARWTENC